MPDNDAGLIIILSLTVAQLRCYCRKLRLQSGNLGQTRTAARHQYRGWQWKHQLPSLSSLKLADSSRTTCVHEDYCEHFCRRARPVQRRLRGNCVAPRYCRPPRTAGLGPAAEPPTPAPDTILQTNTTLKRIEFQQSGNFRASAVHQTGTRRFLLAWPVASRWPSRLSS